MLFPAMYLLKGSLIRIAMLRFHLNIQQHVLNTHFAFMRIEMIESVI